LIVEKCVISLPSLYGLQERKKGQSLWSRWAGRHPNRALPASALYRVLPHTQATGQSIPLFFFRRDCSCPSDPSAASIGSRTRLYDYALMTRNLSNRCCSMAVPAFPDHSHQLYYWMFPHTPTKAVFE